VAEVASLVQETAKPVVQEDVVVQLRGVRKTFNVGTPIATEVLHGIDLTL